jgi:mRNA-binding protein PUF3
VRELQHDILKCVKDQNGNHVIQKAIERVPTEHIQFIIEAFKGQVHTLATHPYGCRVIQRMLEYCTEKDQASVLEELHQSAQTLITDQYGNYVMQHVIEHGRPEDQAKIIELVTAQLLTLSKHKFASNVVEKTIQFGSDQQRRAIIAELTANPSDGSSPLQLMMKDQYGNYVIRKSPSPRLRRFFDVYTKSNILQEKLLGQLKGAEREQFVEDMRPHLNVLKKYNYGKQITAIEKLISNGLPPQTAPMEINSSTATPVLTKGQNSPESSSLPSTNASTVDGPTQLSSPKTVVAEKARPELNIPFNEIS